MAHAETGAPVREDAEHLEIRTIEIADLKDALLKGLGDFRAKRSDILFLALIYPIVSILLIRLAFGASMLPLIFPLVAGFTLLGPAAALAFYELSRRRELGLPLKWSAAFGILGHCSFRAIAFLGILLAVIFLAWLAIAWALYEVTLGSTPPASLGAFIADLFTTARGWALIILGNGIGFLFAVAVLSISVVSFPLLLDHDVDAVTAVRTSIRAVMANPRTMAVWGLIVAVSLAAGFVTLLVGLAVVIPVLGHATWHLYRHVVAH